MWPKVNSQVRFSWNFLFDTVFEVFFAEQCLDFWELEGYTLRNGLSCVSTIKDILLGHLCDEVKRCWGQILNLVDKHKVDELIFVSIKEHLLQNMVHKVHQVIGLVPALPFLVSLKQVINIHFLLLTEKLVLWLFEIALRTQTFLVSSMSLGWAFDNGKDLYPDDWGIEFVLFSFFSFVVIFIDPLPDKSLEEAVGYLDGLNHTILWQFIGLLGRIIRMLRIDVYHVFVVFETFRGFDIKERSFESTVNQNNHRSDGQKLREVPFVNSADGVHDVFSFLNLL